MLIRHLHREDAPPGFFKRSHEWISAADVWIRLILDTVSADACRCIRLMLDTPLMLVELSVMEQRYQAVSLVVHDGESVVEVARRFGVSRQTIHAPEHCYCRSTS